MWLPPPILHRKWGGFMIEGILLKLLILSIFFNIILTVIAFALIIVLAIKYKKENHISAT